jgi:putative redox protein
MPAERFDFPNAQGQKLAALLDRPAGEPRAYALFAHCFTCGKDIRAAKRVAEGLTTLGIAVLRFDFTGLGSSEGEFANTSFSSNVADLVAAANELRRSARAPAILIGHSLGGTAVLAAAAEVAEARAVVTIAAPCDPAHVTGLFKDRLDEIAAKGEVEATLAGRQFRISRAFVDDLAEHKLLERIANLRKALLLFHSPTDEIVSIENASRIFTAAKHPKSFVSLAGPITCSAAAATPPTLPTSSMPGPNAISTCRRVLPRRRTIPRPWSCVKPAKGAFSRRSRSAPTASSPTSRPTSAASTAVRVLTTSCSRAWARARP